MVSSGKFIPWVSGLCVCPESLSVCLIICIFCKSYSFICIFASLNVCLSYSLLFYQISYFLSRYVNMSIFLFFFHLFLLLFLLSLSSLSGSFLLSLSPSIPLIFSFCPFFCVPSLRCFSKHIFIGESFPEIHDMRPENRKIVSPDNNR